MIHKHHVIPRHSGGSDDPGNLIELTIEEHAQAHKELFEKYGKHEDKVAWLALSGQSKYKEFIAERASLGGKIQGKINAETGHISRIQQLSNKVENGRLGGKATIASRKGAFGDPEHRKEVAKLGGKIQGKINAETGHLKYIANQYWDKVKSGEIKRVKKCWYTDGVKSVLVLESDVPPEGFYKGRKIKNG